jgi:hypothetical protein
MRGTGLVEAAHGDARPGGAYPRLPFGDMARSGKAVAGILAPLLRGRRIELLGVVGQHALHVEARHDRGDRLLGHRHPFRRVAERGAAVVHRDHAVLQQLVQGARLVLVALRGIEAVGRRLDRPAVLAVVALAPPAVEHRQVDGAVDRRLHARGARGFQRVDRVVEPDVDAGHHAPRQVQVVAFDQQDAALELALRESSAIWRISSGPARRPDAPCRRR